MQWRSFDTPLWTTKPRIFCHVRWEPERKGRVVVDLRPLNKVTIRDIYPVPTQNDIVLLTQGKRFITVLDAAKFFYQWRVRRDHRARVCVVSHRSLCSHANSLTKIP